MNIGRYDNKSARRRVITVYPSLAQEVSEGSGKGGTGQKKQSLFSYTDAVVT